MVMLVIVLGAVNVPTEGLALIFGVDRILDMMRTVVNVTGDATVATIVASTEGELRQVTEEELAEKGVDIVIYANHLLRSAYPAMIDTATSILKHSRSAEVDSKLLSIKDILELIPGTK